MYTIAFNAEDYSTMFQQTWNVREEKLQQICQATLVRDIDCRFKFRFTDRDARRKELRADVTICESEASNITDRERKTCKQQVIIGDKDFEIAVVEDKSVEIMPDQFCDEELIDKQVNDMLNVIKTDSKPKVCRRLLQDMQYHPSICIREQRRSWPGTPLITDKSLLHE